MSEVLILQVSKDELQQMIEASTAAALNNLKSEQRLNKSQAQQYLKVGYKRLNTLIDSGILSLGGDNRFKLSDLDNYLNGSSVTDTV